MTTTGNGRRAATLAASGVLAVVTAVLVPLGVAHADAKWTYVAQYQDRETCEIAARNYQLNGGVGDGGEWQCVSNGNPASSNDTFALYNVFYT